MQNEQLSLCCKATIDITGESRPNAFKCAKCGRIVGTPIQNEPQLSAEMDRKYKEEFGNVYSSKAGAKIGDELRVGSRCNIQLKHFLATALEEQFRRILFIVYNYHLPEVEYYLKEIRDNMNKDSQEEINEWYEEMIKFGDEEHSVSTVNGEKGNK